MKHATMRAIALALVLTLFSVTAAFAAVPTDVKGATYESAVAFLMDKNVITGYPDGTFQPNQAITRAEVCAIVVRAMNPVPSALAQAPETTFTDKASLPAWAKPYINYAVSKNIIKGYTDGSFQPAGNITYTETIAMVLRAAGYTDSVVGGTWPTNYQQKAAALNLMTNLPAPVTNTNAARWMVAQFVYNSYSQIQTAAGIDFIPGITPVTRVSGQFNSTMTEFDGKPIAKGVKVYTWGKSSQYNAGMTLPAIASAYSEDTIYKFKDASSPACYAMKDGQIVGMILPMDTGYSGRVYGVINGISQRLNGDGDAVSAFETLAAGKAIDWLGRTSIEGTIPTSSGAGTGYLDGTVYELTVSNGQVKKITTDGGIGALAPHADFNEITSGPDVVDTFTDNVVRLTTASGGDLFEVAANATVYVRSSDGEEYTTGSLSDIRSGVHIRAYDITDEGTIANIIVVDKDHAFNLGDA